MSLLERSFEHKESARSCRIAWLTGAGLLAATFSVSAQDASTTTSIATSTTTTAPADPNAALTATLARLKLQAEIAEQRRSLLTSSNAEGVTLPTGKIEREENQILPSAVSYVVYQSFGDMMKAVCTAVGPGPVIVTDLDLRNLESQRMAIKLQFTQMRQRTAEVDAAVFESKKAVDAEFKKPLPPAAPSAKGAPAASGAPPGGAILGAIPGILLGLDAVGAVGKSLAGLAGLFKTDYRISSEDVTIPPEVIRSALVNCPMRIVDPAQIVTSEAQLKIQYVIDLESATRNLRQVIQNSKLALPDYKTRIAELEKAKLTPQADALKLLVGILEAYLAVADSRLTEDQGALDKLFAVNETSGISPLVALARMEALGAIYYPQSTYPASISTSPRQLKVKIAYSSGASRISTAWWRNDRIEFAGGLALTYSIQTINSDYIERTDTYFMQGSWLTLQSESGTTTGALRRLGPN